MPRKPDAAPPEPVPGHIHGPGCSHDHNHGDGHEPVQETYRREMPKLGRNDPCYCGSGRKFKKCHGTTL